MSGLRRFCLIVFALAGALCLCSLALPWIGPYQQEARALMSNPSYYYAMQAVLAITALGIVATLLRALFTPRKRKTVMVSKSGNDQITVTTKAISSQATHVIEESGNLVAEKVQVSAKKRGGVSVNVRVRPHQTVNIAQEGQRLHDSLEEGLAVICGDKVRRINLEFLEAEAPAPAQDVVVERIDELEVPQSVLDHAAQLSEGDEGITVSVASLGSQTEVHDASAETETAEASDTEGEVA